jgi:hypothetical protein
LDDKKILRKNTNLDKELKKIITKARMRFLMMDSIRNFGKTSAVLM